METELDLSHPEYIKVMISGLIVKPELISLMGEILQHPQYQEKHTLWDFRQASLGLSIGDLKELVGIMKLYKPENKKFADRSALLVPGKFNSAIAEMFVSMTRLLPVKYHVFNDYDSAEAYLLS